MKHSPSSFSLVLQVGAIMLATLLVVLIFFRIRPSVLPPLTLQESVQSVLEKTSPATVMIVDDPGVIGGGVLIDSTTVLTSKHLLQIGKRYGIRFADDEIVWWSPLALHPELDLALIVLEKPYSHFAQPISSHVFLKAGEFVIAQWVLAQAQSFVRHFGIIADTRANLTVGDKTIRNLILTDVPFQWGYSGAPLFNLKGELIGIHTAFGANTWVGWSTPVDESIIADWKKNLR